MADLPSSRLPPERLPTQIHGVDTILRGGLFKGGLYILEGRPGVGKTIFASQVCFHHAAVGGSAIYVTLLAEEHGHLLSYLQSLAFFNADLVGSKITYFVGYTELTTGGLDSLLQFLRKLIHDRRPTILAMDGLTSVQLAAESGLALRNFIHNLQVTAAGYDCTTVLLTSANGREAESATFTMADGLFHFTRRLVGNRTVRELEVSKFRGSDFLDGRHTYTISDQGISVYPRFEALVGSPGAELPEAERLTFGVPHLDAMLGGGLIPPTTTMVYGSVGSGKTILGFHFLAEGLRQGQPGLYIGFDESPPLLLQKATAVGLDFGSALSNGQLELLWQLPYTIDLNRLAERVLAIVAHRQVKRLVIDELSGLQQASVYPEQFAGFLQALVNALRGLGVTSLLTLVLPSLFGPELNLPTFTSGSPADNVLLLRYVELHSQLYRLLSVIKVHAGEYDPTLHEFKITSSGIEVARTFESAQAVLTGIAVPRVPGAIELPSSQTE